MRHSSPLPSQPVRSLPNRAKAAVALATFLVACGGAEPRLQARDQAAPVLATLVNGAGPGQVRLRASDLAGARAAFEADLSRDPDDLGALNDLAVSYHLEAHSDAARRLLDEVVAKGDVAEQQAALVNLGELYAVDGYVSASQAYLETARSLDPSRPGPWYALAVLADSRGEAERGRASLREALARDRSGSARAAFAYAYPEERAHLEALLAEAAGDLPAAAAKWRSLAAGRFPALAATAERHLAGD
jgi:Tfp pilus assembly protein PilF